MAVSLAALRAGRHFTPQIFFFFFLLLVRISVRDNKPQGLVRLEGLGNLIRNIHLIGSRTTTLPRARTILK
jgi:hypothetical protein